MINQQQEPRREQETSSAVHFCIIPLVGIASPLSLERHSTDHMYRVIPQGESSHVSLSFSAQTIQGSEDTCALALHESTKNAFQVNDVRELVDVDVIMVDGLELSPIIPD